MLITKLDNVEVNIEDGHKYAARDIQAGENIIKYGQPIGHATEDIAKGEHVHSHNMKTNLSGKIEYSYDPQFYPEERIDSDKTFMDYHFESRPVDSIISDDDAIRDWIQTLQIRFCGKHVYCFELQLEFETIAECARYLLDNNLYTNLLLSQFHQDKAD